ncbi:MAG: DUF1330 domain-containing protein [Janthinobacterium lividum]
MGGGPLAVPTGEPDFSNGAIIRFADHDTASAWYNSPAYQAIFGDRAAGIDCRSRPLG